MWNHEEERRSWVDDGEDNKQNSTRAGEAFRNDEEGKGDICVIRQRRGKKHNSQVKIYLSFATKIHETACGAEEINQLSNSSRHRDTIIIIVIIIEDKTP